MLDIHLPDRNVTDKCKTCISGATVCSDTNFSAFKVRLQDAVHFFRIAALQRLDFIPNNIIVSSKITRLFGDIVVESCRTRNNTRGHPVVRRELGVAVRFTSTLCCKLNLVQTLFYKRQETLKQSQLCFTIKAGRIKVQTRNQNINPFLCCESIAPRLIQLQFVSVRAERFKSDKLNNSAIIAQSNFAPCSFRIQQMIFVDGDYTPVCNSFILLLGEAIFRQGKANLVFRIVKLNHNLGKELDLPLCSMTSFKQLDIPLVRRQSHLLDILRQIIGIELTCIISKLLKQPSLHICRKLKEVHKCACRS